MRSGIKHTSPIDASQTTRNVLCDLADELDTMRDLMSACWAIATAVEQVHRIPLEAVMATVGERIDRSYGAVGALIDRRAGETETQWQGSSQTPAAGEDVPDIVEAGNKIEDASEFLEAIYMATDNLEQNQGRALKIVCGAAIDAVHAAWKELDPTVGGRIKNREHVR